MPEAKLPNRLYKYRSVEPASRDFTAAIFRTNKVWYSRASAFNDPFDCDHFIDIDRDADEWRDVMERFSQSFSTVIALSVGKFIQAFWNTIAEGVNQKAEAESRTRRMSKLSNHKLLDVSRRVGGKAELTFGGRRPSDIVDDERVGPVALNEILNRYLEQAKDAIDGRFGVFSLAEKSDNILMWSHYSDDHGGVCIEFDTEAHPNAFPNIHAVKYSEQSPVIKKQFANILMNLKDKDPSLDEEFLARLARQDVEAEWSSREIRSWFLTKSILWEYEREWRSIVPGPGLKRIPAAAISGVVLGCEASAETEQAVRAWVHRRRRKVAISRALKREGEFALDIVPA